MSEKQRFYILSLEHSRGGEATWWRPDERGYTTDLKQAGTYDLEGARQACGMRSRRGVPPEIAIPVDAPLVVRHTVDLYQQAESFQAFVKRYEEGFAKAEPLHMVAKGETGGAE